MRRNLLILVVRALFILYSLNALAQSFDGSYGASRAWGSGWLDLRQPIELESGKCLRIEIGGTASKVVVRLLRRDDDPSRASGIVGGIHNVPESRKIDVQLLSQFPNIKQISVHGNPNAWHFDLGGKNGPATLISATSISCKSQ